MSLFCLNSQSNAQQKKDNAETKILVAYFSCTGNTESVAKSISKATGGTLYRITLLLPTLTGETKTAEVQ